jgi:hypothetical protein
MMECCVCCVCRAKALKKCSLCDQPDYYCGPACQLVHWPTHSGQCAFFIGSQLPTKSNERELATAHFVAALAATPKRELWRTLVEAPLQSQARGPRQFEATNRAITESTAVPSKADVQQALRFMEEAKKHPLLTSDAKSTLVLATAKFVDASGVSAVSPVMLAILFQVMGKDEELRDTVKDALGFFVHECSSQRAFAEQTGTSAPEECMAPQRRR